MSQSIKQKLVELREDALKAVDRDAKRQGRSTNKQIEAILLAYYGLENMNLRDMQDVRAEVEKIKGESPFEADLTEPIGDEVTARRARRMSHRPSKQTKQGRQGGKK